MIFSQLTLDGVIDSHILSHEWAHVSICHLDLSQMSWWSVWMGMCHLHLIHHQMVQSRLVQSERWVTLIMLTTCSSPGCLLAVLQMIPLISKTSCYFSWIFVVNWGCGNAHFTRGIHKAFPTGSLNVLLLKNAEGTLEEHSASSIHYVNKINSMTGCSRSLANIPRTVWEFEFYVHRALMYLSGYILWIFPIY